MQVLDALSSRRSIRAFASSAVPETTVRDILHAARLSPSGGNLQPWRVYVLMDRARSAFGQRIADLLTDYPEGQGGEVEVYPADLPEPYRTHRRRLGELLYASIGVDRQDRESKLRHFARNYDFFGAPVGLFFSIDRRMGHSQWLDLGMFMQTVMLVARSYDLHTCTQGAWTAWQEEIRAFCEMPDNEIVVAGMALGFAADGAPINSFPTARMSLEEFAVFVRS